MQIPSKARSSFLPNTAIRTQALDKLCKINREFEQFIEQTDRLLTAQERYFKLTEKELEEYCDRYFESDLDIELYCRENPSLRIWIEQSKRIPPSSFFTR